MKAEHGAGSHCFLLGSGNAQLSVVLIDNFPRLFLAGGGNMGIVVAFFISLDYDDFSGTGKNAVALLRKPARATAGIIAPL